jgi:CheY-like chemotaxis protein
VITDILMPTMDGFTLAQKLRTELKTSRIPIIFLSATYLTPEDKAFGLNLGAVRFIEKPIDTEDFLLTVAEILTQGLPDLPIPLDEREFYQGYRQRLDSKLRHKNTQMARIERLLQSLPPEQRSPFESLLTQTTADRDEIQKELDQLYRLLSDNLGDQASA